MNFGFVMLALALTVAALFVAKAHDEIVVNTPATRGIVAAVHSNRKHRHQITEHQTGSDANIERMEPSLSASNGQVLESSVR